MFHLNKSNLTRSRTLEGASSTRARSPEAVKFLFIENLKKAGAEVYEAQNADALIEALKTEVLRLHPKTIVHDAFAASSALEENLRSAGFSGRVVSLDGPHEAVKLALASAEVGITRALFGVAETGSIVVSSLRTEDILASALPPNHVAVLDSANIVEQLTEAESRLTDLSSERGRGRLTSFITGPSRTGDIESQLTLGVHGPHRLVVFLTGPDGA